MNLAHLFEATMLVCFGFSWPLNVIKAYKARTAKGTSLAFILLIITGYIAGISAKMINHQYNYVLVVYFLNLAIVMTNIFVYIRNKALDRKAANKKSETITKLNISELAEAQEENMLNYSNSLDELINKTSTRKENENGVILLGGTLDEKIPVAELADNFSFTFDIYNKSSAGLSISNAVEYFEKNISSLVPEGILVHLGDSDISLFQNDSTAFDNYYLSLIEKIKNTNSKCRIALISVNNPAKEKTIALLNAHIKAIADTSKAVFINLDNSKLWNPEATKASVDFAYSMGLNIRKPLRDVAEILYSYAYNNIKANAEETMVG
ncbi:MAG: hypothetical protein MJ162_03660 [Treponema sp.]|nr:hypothetical protein [Treponema sp.]